MAAVGAVLVLAIRGYGQLLLTQPWNPYLPVLSWIVVLLAVWAVLCGDALMLVPAVVAGSLCAQTHVPYLVPAGVLVLAALGHVAWWGRHDRRQRRLVAATAVLGVVLWVPPVVDQLTNDPGNIRKLVDHFGSPPEPALGWWPRRAPDARPPRCVGRLRPSADARPDASSPRPRRGAGRWSLALWAVAAVVAWRVGSRALQWLHVVVGAALVLGAVSMARIFGKPWYYLTLWAWGITAVMLGAIAGPASPWSATCAAGRAGDRHALDAVALVGAARRSGGRGVVGDGGVVRRCPGARGSPQRARCGHWPGPPRPRW